MGEVLMGPLDRLGVANPLFGYAVPMDDVDLALAFRALGPLCFFSVD